ncbi:MAG TPA: biliverdin-producing heme oxygenase [Puia sp.]|nr:biliverdin-producing heme oxygenase [Puia sp.]
MLTNDLKENTYPEHQASEKKMIVALKKIETPAGYVHMLNWMYGFFAPLEALIQKQLTPELLPDIDRRSRAEYLLWDIRDLGLLNLEFRICRDLPEVDSVEQAIGALYVLEGSTLGGRIIADMLQQQLGTAVPTSYFNGYGEENSRMWQTYKDFLNQPRTPEQQTAILEAAKATFITLKNWIDKHELQPQL